jgi:uncharacterized membrane protein HdeD (DUF308 family)
MTTVEGELRREAREATGLWWLMLMAGIAWLIISLVILRFDTRSVTTVGVIIGLVFLGGAANELLTAMVVQSWRWAHVGLAVLFVVGAVWCFVSPDDAFWALASALGFLLVLKGTFDIILAAETRVVNPLWGLGLTAGILEVLLGFWASQQFYPARAALLLIWVGFAAMFRGIGEIATAVQLRQAHKELSAA